MQGVYKSRIDGNFVYFCNALLYQCDIKTTIIDCDPHEEKVEDID
jgi:hypothetical protein